MDCNNYKNNKVCSTTHTPPHPHHQQQNYNAENSELTYLQNQCSDF